MAYQYVYIARLGLASSQLGVFELGVAVPESGTRVDTTATISEVIGVVVLPHLRWFQSNTVTVNQTIAAYRDKVVAVSDTVTITEARQVYSSAETRLSQYALEVLYATASDARVTAYCIEVIYKRATAATVIDTITVVPSIKKQSPVRVTVTSLITVTSTPALSSNINRQSRTDTVTVVETRARRSTVVHITVVDSITSGEADAPYDDTKRISQSHTVSVTSTQVGYANPRRMTVTDQITTSFVEDVHDTRPHTGVVSVITVSESYGLYNPNFTLTNTISVHDGIFFANTNVRLAVTSNITVVSTPSYRVNPNRQLISHLVLLPDHIPTNFAQAFPNPRRMEVNSVVVLTDFNSDTLPSREITVEQGVRVRETIRNNSVNVSYSDVVEIIDSFQGAGLTYTLDTADSVLVLDGVISAPNPLRMAVDDSIFVRMKALAHAPLTETPVTERVLLTYSIDFDIRRKQNIVDTVTVTSTPTLKTSPVRITVRDVITVTPSNHFSPVHMFLAHTITVTSRPKIDTLIVRDRITVTDKITRSTFVRFIQSLQFSEQVATTRGFNRTIVDPLIFSETLSRNVNWNRSAVDTLLFYDENEYPRDTSIGVLPIPIAIGIIVPNNVTLTGQHGTIVLPPPQWGDREGIVASVVPKRVMSGGTYTFIKTTDRRSLAYNFRVSRLKYFELRTWVIRNLSDTIAIVDWKGGFWTGKLTKTPIELVNSPSTIAEWIVVDLEFEAVKLGG